MGDIATKIVELNTVKSSIKGALVNKGIDMTNVPFTEYASKIDEIKTQTEILIHNITYKNKSRAYTEPFKSNSKLKFRNASTIGDATTVNGCTISIEYSDDGSNWTQYNISGSTISNTSNLNLSYTNSSYPGTLRWQYSTNNTCIFTTNEKHLYWRAKAVSGNDSGYDQTFSFESAYDEVITSETVS